MTIETTKYESQYFFLEIFEKVIFCIPSLPSTWNWQGILWLNCRCSVFCESLWRWNIRQHITVHMVVRSLNVSERWGAFLIKCHTSQQWVGGHKVRHLCYLQEKQKVRGWFPDFIPDTEKMFQLFMCLLRILACKHATLVHTKWTWYDLVNICVLTFSFCAR